MEIEAIISTMHQNSIDKYSELKITTNAIIANQTNKNCFEEQVFDDKLIRLISTDTRGLGKNRNIGLIHSTAEIVHFADDDMLFVDGYEQIVLNAFDKNPRVHALVFNVVSLNEDRKIKEHKKNKKLRFKDVKSHGIVGTFFKREALIKYNLWFSCYFGAGAICTLGEDTLLLKKFFDEKLTMISIPLKIADVKQDESSWFVGINEKLFFDRGALYATLMNSKFKAKLAARYHVFKHRAKYKHFGLAKAYNIMRDGIKKYTAR
ncbi:MAG: glycosyltransferase family 2 protein [Firmicutes bacterium]|nr:glycosyltransferase family 2 protein [Bacillota bacterium]